MVRGSGVNGTYGDITNTSAIQQGRVIRNAFIDKFEFETRGNMVKDPEYKNFYEGPVDADHAKIRQGELCFSRKRDPILGVEPKNYKRQRRGTTSANLLDDGAPVVFSTPNGMGVRTTRETNLRVDRMGSSEKKRAITKQVQFEGIAQTDLDYGVWGVAKHTESSALPLQIGGVESLINTGTEDIIEGQWVVWEPPEPYGKNAPNIMGNEKKKKLFVTKSLNYHELINITSLSELYSMANGQPDEMYGLIEPFINGANEAAYELWAGQPEQRDVKVIRDKVWPSFTEREIGIYGPEHYLKSIIKFIAHVAGVFGGSNMGRRLTVGAMEDNLTYIKKYTHTVNAFYRPNHQIMRMVRECLFPSRYMETLFGNAQPDWNMELENPVNPNRYMLQRSDFRRSQNVYSMAFKEFLNSQSLAISEVHSRIIGRALTSASANCQFDIVLGHGYII